MSEYPLEPQPDQQQPVDLQAVFNAVGGALEARRVKLNQMDELNHNHGNHMVEIFQLAAQAALEEQGARLPDAIQRAADLLSARAENGSAQVYGRGLSLLAEQFRQGRIELDDLLRLVQEQLDEGKSDQDGEASRSGEITKALLSALADWEGTEARMAKGAQAKSGGLDMGYLFTVGMAYLQAKQKGGDRLDVLSETVVSASPLGAVPYRHASGVIAVRALLETLGG
jgi:hypothetical protein